LKVIRSIRHLVQPRETSAPGETSEREPARFYPPARIFGTPVDESCLAGITAARDFFLEPLRIERIELGRIIGFSAVLGPDNTLHSPEPLAIGSIADALRKNRFNHEGFILDSGADGLRAHFAGRSCPRFVGMDALFLPTLEPGNYGSFIFRQLPLLLHLKRNPTPFDCYIVGDRTAWLLEALSILELPRRPIFSVRETSGDTFRSIQICLCAPGEAFLSRSTLSGIAALVRQAQAICEPTTGAEAIYVSRVLSPISRPFYRPMLNELDIEETMKENGFQIVYPETLGLIDQISVFSNAKRIIGPSGSGMLNAVFSSAGTKVVDIETFHVTVRQHANLYSPSEKEYAFLFEQPDRTDQRPLFQRRWRLGEHLLREALA